MPKESYPKGILMDPALERISQSKALSHEEAELRVARCLQEWQDARVGERIRDVLDTGARAYDVTVGRMLALVEDTITCYIHHPLVSDLDHIGSP